jgi:hypothetical protein
MPRNDYEERRAARVERYRERADKLRREGHARFNSSNIRTVRGLQGQPILIGHHSEKRHRRLLERADNDMRKGVESVRKADHYENRAESAEENHAISSDDPAALTRLREKLAELEDWQSTAKADNATMRKAKLTADDPAFDEKIEALGLHAATIEEIKSLRRLCPYHLRPYCRIPQYAMSNNNANIRRVRQRIAELEAIEATADEPERSQQFSGFTIRENREANRLQIVFPDKPQESVRAILKSRGFRWSPLEGAWQRMLTPGVWNVAEYVAQQIEKSQERHATTETV